MLFSLFGQVDDKIYSINIIYNTSVFIFFEALVRLLYPAVRFI